MLTAESLGGGTPPAPSLADVFYVGFFPLCFLGFAFLIRRGNRSSLVTTSLDGLIAGLGVAALSAAFVVAAVIKVTGAGSAVDGDQPGVPARGRPAVRALRRGARRPPRGFRPFFALACVALAANAIGDGFNLLQPASRLGYVSQRSRVARLVDAAGHRRWMLPPEVGTPGDGRSGRVSRCRRSAPLVSMVILVTPASATSGRPAVALATVTLLVAGLRLVLTVSEAQALNSARFRSLIDNTWDLIVVAEADLRIAYITPSSQRVLGYSPAELEGSPSPTSCIPTTRSLGRSEPPAGLTADADGGRVRDPHAACTTVSGERSPGTPPTSSRTRR